MDNSLPNDGQAGKFNAMHKQIADLDKLPPMPNVAAELLRLSRDPDTMAKDVTSVIETDPAIVAQIMRYARSSWYSYQGEIDTIEEAIFSVLGMEMVTNMAIGMSAGKVFTIPTDGPLNAKSLWRHAVYCAAFSEALARVISVRPKIKPGAAYLSGLLHNIGFMIIGHCCPAEFIKLSQTMEMDFATPISELEQQIYGTTHAEVAAELMGGWNLPEQVIYIMRHHHDENYEGKYQQEVLLVQVVNCALTHMDIGDEVNQSLNEHALQVLGLTEDAVYAVMTNIFSDCANLDSMITQMAA